MVLKRKIIKRELAVKSNYGEKVERKKEKVVSRIFRTFRINGHRDQEQGYHSR